MHMNQLASLQDKVKRRFPDTTSKLNLPPVREDGTWVLDIHFGDLWLVVEWTPPNSFGVSKVTDNTGYGERPDNIYPTSEEAFDRIQALLEGAPYASATPESLETPPEGLYGVWSEPMGHLGNPRWITSLPLSYEPAIALADQMNRANKKWHYYAKPVPA